MNCRHEESFIQRADSGTALWSALMTFAGCGLSVERIRSGSSIGSWHPVLAFSSLGSQLKEQMLLVPLQLAKPTEVMSFQAA